VAVEVDAPGSDSGPFPPLPLAVLVDATLVRAILVPAFMKLAGRANWWRRHRWPVSTNGLASANILTPQLHPARRRRSSAMSCSAGAFGRLVSRQAAHPQGQVGRLIGRDAA